MYKYEKMRNGIWYDDSGDGLRVQRSLHEGEFTMPRYHMHATYEVHFVVHGHTELECGTLTAEMRSPYIAVHRPYMPHRLRAKYDDAPYYRFILNFSDEFLEQAKLLVPAVESLFMYTFFALEITEEQCREILPRLEDAFRLYRSSRDGACKLAVAMALDEMAAVLPHSRIIAAGGSIRYLDEVIRYIIAHISEKLVCADVAAQFFISESKLAKDFKRCFGLAFNQYIMQLRVKMAKDLLSRGETGAVAAKACGFCSPSYFIRVFKSYTGRTPSEFVHDDRENSANA